MPAPGTVPESEQARWVRWAIPLPKKINISGKVELPAGDVKIRLRQNAGEVEKTAAEQLVTLLKQKGNADGNGEAFEIFVGVCDPAGKIEDVTVVDAADLADLPNWEQAYCIRSVGDNRLVLTALDQRGVYYAVQTLRQLLESRFSRGKVTMPLVSVTDWPDLAERGQWGGLGYYPVKEVEWMAAHKLNYIEYHVGLKVNENGRATAAVSPERIEHGRLHAVGMAPIITHLMEMGRTGMYRIYPGLEGRGDGANGCPCASNSKLADLLADWMCSMAEQGATKVSGWLTEGTLHQCGCEKCRKAGERSQYFLETRQYVKAWHMARRQYPGLDFHIMLTQGSYAGGNEKILAEVPTEIGILFYHCSQTYNSLREPMITPLLTEYAARDGWLGVAPQLTPSFETVCPWSAPHFIKCRMREFVDKKLKNLAAYVTPNNRLWDFNVTASAEWSWNSTGRSEREFAAAWATRKGIRLKDPAATPDDAANAVGQWADLLGPIGWDVYGTRVPFTRHLRRAGDMVTARARPALGKKGIFRNFPTEQHINENLAKCDQAMAIVERIDSQEILEETRFISGLMKMLKEIHDIAARTFTEKSLTYDERMQLQSALNRLILAGMQTTGALQEWERITGPDYSNYARFRVETLMSIDRAVIGVGDALSFFGVRNHARDFVCDEIGKWTSDDFESEERITRKWNISDCLLRDGVFEVKFHNASHFALDIYRAAIVSAPTDDPDNLTELSADEHHGHTGFHGSRENAYTLTLDQRDPNKLYFLVAEIKGHPETDFSGVIKHCKGNVSIARQLAKGGDPAIALAEVRPLTDKEYEKLVRSTVPKFGDKGLRVGVVQGGYGSDSILTHLATVDGLDAQPVTVLNSLALQACRVVVLPQLKTLLGNAVAKALDDFVRAGGGLITTHDAVGYRGQPLLITDVCARGLRHVLGDKQWMVMKEHPVTKGIDLNIPLFHIYYDHVELKCGPKGIILAKAPQTGEPVVVAGDFYKGRYVACGILLGYDSAGTEIAPTGAEQILLENVVKWCGGTQ